MFKKIAANDLIIKMEQDPDIVRLKKIKPEDFLKVMYACKMPGGYPASDKGHSVLDVLTKDGALNTLAFLFNSLSHRKEGKAGYFYRNLPCNYMAVYDSGLEHVVVSHGKYIFDLEVIVRDLILKLNGGYFQIKLKSAAPSIGNEFSLFPTIINNASDDALDFIYSKPVDFSEMLSLTHINMMSEHFSNSLRSFDSALSAGSVGHITNVLIFLLELMAECQQNRGDVDMSNYLKQQSRTHFLEKKIAFDTMFIFVLLCKVLDAIKRANMLQSAIAIPGSPLQVFIDENFKKDSFFIIKEQRKLLMKIVWYCSLLRLKNKKESVLDENGPHLSSDVIKHVYSNVSWMDSNSTRVAQYFWSLVRDALNENKHSDVHWVNKRNHIRRISDERLYQPVLLIDLSTRGGIKNFMGEHFDPKNVLWRTSKPKKTE
ncbi:TPA: hypothetical protein R4Y36_003507 [Enterobacter hormaechei subsp. hoffmannii]|uniref:hypothetical protein n=1 Tax=Enterobacter cloacae complex TaxID=354276 RepID=UPI0021D8353D|nr:MULTISPECIES: hypothetical protein [Enterobacter cloacae complex]MCU8698603.1 hypothetical protein [Enterobacter cloacae]MDH0802219.1 hypothetical protein [Enterobacter hormaechei]HAV2177990.1 hypothetical protein [Enterobacter cloacae]HED2450555.1 hypothetical protein [Enterobacter hormaechei subsp. hoffmannii]